MAKKKKTNNTTSFKEAIGFDKIFHNERLNFFLGHSSLTSGRVLPTRV